MSLWFPEPRWLMMATSSNSSILRVGTPHVFQPRPAKFRFLGPDERWAALQRTVQFLPFGFVCPGCGIEPSFRCLTMLALRACGQNRSCLCETCTCVPSLHQAAFRLISLLITPQHQPERFTVSSCAISQGPGVLPFPTRSDGPCLPMPPARGCVSRPLCE